MKTIYLLSFLVLFFSCATHRTGWKETWCEHFNTSRLDTSLWSKIPRGNADWQNYMSDFDSLYQVRNSSLVLRGIVNKSVGSDTAAYLTGGVWTMGKKNFENGLLEIRAKLGSAQGAWPAFWMLGAGKRWPDGGEIDIMEHLNHDSIVYQTVHSAYTLYHNIKKNPPSSTTAAIRPGDWNTYGVELGQDSICFYVNSKKTMTYPRIQTDLEGQFPYGIPMYLLIDMQLGGKWVGSVDPQGLPVEMEIDYVKFYQKKGK